MKRRFVSTELRIVGEQPSGIIWRIDDYGSEEGRFIVNCKYLKYLALCLHIIDFDITFRFLDKRINNLARHGTMSKVTHEGAIY